MLPLHRVLLAVLVGGVSPAGAGPAQVTIDRVDASVRPATVRFQIEGSGQDVTGATVKVYVDGREVHRSGQSGLVVRLDAAPRRHQVAFVIDVSKSLTAAGWETAQRAAAEMLQQLPEDWPVALATVGDAMREVVPATTDRGTLRTALLKLAPTDARTLLHDTLFKMLGRGHTLVVVVTDGVDSGSALQAGDVIARAAAAGVPVAAVDVAETETTGRAFLRRLAAATGGWYLRDTRSLVPTLVSAAPPAGRPVRGLASFDDERLDTPGLHDLTIALLDGKTGQVLGQAAQAFSTSPSPTRAARAPWLTTLLALVALALALALILATRRDRATATGTTAAAVAAPLAVAVSAAVPAEAAAAVPVPSAEPPQMRHVRERLRALGQEAAALEHTFVEYGNPLEQKAQRWRATCQETVRRAVAPMRSCWLMRSEAPAFEVIYNEILASLAGLGLAEIAPRPGEPVDERDLRYLIAEKRGRPPYTVVKVLAPGFFFSPRMPWPKEPADEVLLEPAELAVEGAGPTGTAAGG